jgi:hypothetical protein
MPDYLPLSSLTKGVPRAAVLLRADRVPARGPLVSSELVAPRTPARAVSVPEPRRDGVVARRGSGSPWHLCSMKWGSLPDRLPSGNWVRMGHTCTDLVCRHRSLTRGTPRRCCPFASRQWPTRRQPGANRTREPAWPGRHRWYWGRDDEGCAARLGLGMGTANSPALWRMLWHVSIRRGSGSSEPTWRPSEPPVPSFVADFSEPRRHAGARRAPPRRPRVTAIRSGARSGLARAAGIGRPGRT